MGRLSRKPQTRKASPGKTIVPAPVEDRPVGTIRMTLKPTPPRVRLVLRSDPARREAAATLAVVRGTERASATDGTFVSHVIRPIEFGTMVPEDADDVPSALELGFRWDMAPTAPLAVDPSVVSVEGAGRRSALADFLAPLRTMPTAAKNAALVLGVVLACIVAWFGVDALMTRVHPVPAVAVGPKHRAPLAVRPAAPVRDGHYSGGTTAAAAGAAVQTAPASCYSSFVFRATGDHAAGGLAANSVQLLDGRIFTVNAAEASDTVMKWWMFQRIEVCSRPVDGDLAGALSFTLDTGGNDAHQATLAN